MTPADLWSEQERALMRQALRIVFKHDPDNYRFRIATFESEDTRVSSSAAINLLHKFAREESIELIEVH